MRLLNVKSKRLEEFFGKNIPPYAILSHTWGEHEVTFAQLQKSPKAAKTAKIEGCCRQAKEDGYRYVWIDTCSIDKSSSSELSEAINSMYKWYTNARVCYVYLEDIAPDSAQKEITRARWFSRGWTLQELLAPLQISFYALDWSKIGGWNKLSVSGLPRNSLTELISEATGIPTTYLYRNFSPDRACVAEKMKWASRRQTTREEDETYCLLGLFDVNMPLLYGEGRKAFLRLQREIMQISDDHTLFAWSYGSYYQQRSHATLMPCERGLTTSPSAFAHTDSVKPWKLDGLRSSHYQQTNKGIEITIPCCVFSNSNTILAALNCADTQYPGTVVALPLTRSSTDEDVYQRMMGHIPISVPESLFSVPCYQKIYITSRLFDQSMSDLPDILIVDIDLISFWCHDFFLAWISPPPETFSLQPNSNAIRFLHPTLAGNQLQRLIILNFTHKRYQELEVALEFKFTRTSVTSLWVVESCSVRVSSLDALGSYSVIEFLVFKAELLHTSLEWHKLERDQPVIFEIDDTVSIDLDYEPYHAFTPHDNRDVVRLKTLEDSVE